MLPSALVLNAQPMTLDTKPIYTIVSVDMSCGTLSGDPPFRKLQA